MKKQFLLFAGGILLLAACNNQSQESANTTEETNATEESVADVSVSQIWATDSVLETPESVYYHADEDVLYVSNIAGGPTEKDGRGYISKLSTEGQILEQEWVTGLHAPKGMAVMDGKLYVTNIDELVEIDIESGQISNRYAVEGASFLNDVAVSDNKILFSDSNEGKIHVFENGEVQLWHEGLDRPNGLIEHDGKILLASSGSHDVKEISENEEGETLAEGIGAGDGLVVVDDNNYLVSNWQGEVYYIGANQQKTKILDTKEQNINSADIEYIQDQGLLLVPTFHDNRVVAYRLNRVE